MAPATVAGVTVRRGSSQASTSRIAWTRDTIINAIQEWVATYDEPPRAADWNPSSAKWSGQTWRIERYRRGRADGTAWPSLNAAKRPFDGSLSAAVRAAGFEPPKPGPRRRRDVAPAQADRLQMTPDVRVLLDAALAAARDADRKADALEVRLARAQERSVGLAAERDAARRRSAGADARARASSEIALSRAETALRRSREGADAAAAAAAEARSRAERLAGRLGELERTDAALREERDALRERLDRAIAETEAQAELVRIARAEAARPFSDGPAASAASATAGSDPAGGPGTAPTGSGPARSGAAVPASVAAALREARADAAQARRDADAAERRAMAAERQLRDRATAARSDSGEPTREQAAALREGAASGAAGPAALGEALTGLARARRTGGRPAVRDALWDVARAAVAWRERL